MKGLKPREERREDRAALQDLTQAVQRLATMKLSELQAMYGRLYAVPTRSKNAQFLRKKLAWKLQEEAEGGLSPETLGRIQELAPEALPVRKPKATRTPNAARKAATARAKVLDSVRDPRLPAVGAVLTKEVQGVIHEVIVLESGFTWKGQTFRSLSAVAKAMTGTTWNGFGFFGLLRKEQP